MFKFPLNIFDGEVIHTACLSFYIACNSITSKVKHYLKKNNLIYFIRISWNSIKNLYQNMVISHNTVH